MNVLVDYNGHADLFYSFIQLFEKRLGWKVYFPFGEEWVTRGFLYRQYSLDMDEHYHREEHDGLLTISAKMEPDSAFYEIHGLSFQKFLDTAIDVVVTSVYFNERLLSDLVRAHRPNAVFVRQIANIHEKPLGFCKNFLLGAAYHPTDYGHHSPQEAFRARGLNCFIYYPEQHPCYHYTDPVNHKQVTCIARHLAPEDLRAWSLAKEALLPKGFSFTLLGRGNVATGEDSIPHIMLPKAIREMGFAWYTKPEGGGGYTSRQALACGRPLILRRRYSSAHTSIECNLYRHGVNCVDLDSVRTERGYDFSTLVGWSDPETHRRVCRQTATLFEQDTRFSETAVEIGKWIESLPKGAP